MTDKNKKDAWDKWQIGAAVAMPLALALVGYFLKLSLVESETNASRFALAVEVLSKPPEETASVEGLREWAVSEFNAVARSGLGDQLLTRRLPTTESEILRPAIPGCCVDCGDSVLCGAALTAPCGSCQLGTDPTGEVDPKSCEARCGNQGCSIACDEGFAFCQCIDNTVRTSAVCGCHSLHRPLQ